MENGSVLVLTTEGLASHVGGLGTYIRELRQRLEDRSAVRVKFHEIPYDARYLRSPGHDGLLDTLLHEASIVHANDYFTAYATQIRRAVAPLVTTVHMLHQRFSYLGQVQDFGLDGAALKRLEDTALSRSTRLVAVSHFVEQELRELGIPLPPIDVVHNASGESFFRSIHARRSEPVKLGISGRLVTQKGSETIPDLLKGLRELPFPWTLDVVGTGPDLPNVARGIAASGVAQRCRLRGWVPPGEMPGVYASWDATVCLTKYEPFGIAPLESLASGTPVVGCIVGGMREYCKEGVNSFAAEEESVGSVVNAVRRWHALDRPPSPEEVRSSVVAFRWDRSAQQMCDIYRALGAQRQRASEVAALAGA